MPFDLVTAMMMMMMMVMMRVNLVRECIVWWWQCLNLLSVSSTVPLWYRRHHLASRTKQTAPATTHVNTENWI